MENHHSEEISLKDIIVKFREYAWELLTNWKIYLYIGIPLVLYNAYSSIQEDYRYKADLSFMINEDDGGGLSSVMGLLGQFGLSGGGGDANFDKILELLKSRKITEQVIFDTVEINQSSDLLANHVLNHLDTINEWYYIPWYKRWRTDMEEANESRKFRFSSDQYPYFDENESNVLKHIYKQLMGQNDESDGPMMHCEYSKKSGILSIETTSLSPELALVLANGYFDHLSEFYVEKTIEKQEFQYQLLTAKQDSIENEWHKAMYGSASYSDRSKGIFSKTSQVKQLELLGRAKALESALVKISEHVEMADFSLKNKTPFIQIIDRPLAPLSATKNGLLVSIITAIILAGIIATVFIIGRKIYRDAMA